MLPSTGLRATSGQIVDLSTEGRPWVVVYCYPRTGQPDAEPLGGAAAWNAIPGARGCTPQSCAYRDHHAELAALGATVYGLSTQDTEYQSEAVQRLHLPFSLLSDAKLEFTLFLRLPTFTYSGLELIKRLTLIAHLQAGSSVLSRLPSDADAGRDHRRMADCPNTVTDERREATGLLAVLAFAPRCWLTESIPSCWPCGKSVVDVAETTRDDATCLAPAVHPFNGAGGKPNQAALRPSTLLKSGIGLFAIGIHPA
jgi:peroxiredoxin